MLDRFVLIRNSIQESEFYNWSCKNGETTDFYITQWHVGENVYLM